MKKPEGRRDLCGTEHKEESDTGETGESMNGHSAPHFSTQRKTISRPVTST